MRIDYLEITSDWKNLCNLRIDFDQTRDLTVLLGRNGSAKSNLLEALILIFRNIDLGEPSPFSYEIAYFIKGRYVRLQGTAEKQPKGIVDNKVTSLKEIRSTWLPRHIVGYYSGSSDRFEELFYRHDLLARSETLVPAEVSTVPEKLPFRKFICARPVHGLFSLLAFYFSDDHEVNDFLQKLPRIEAFDSALLIVRRPIWAKRSARPEDFWGARGPVRELLERIQNYSLGPLTRNIRVKPDFATRETHQVMYLFLPDIKSLRQLSNEYSGDPGALFQALDTMRLSGLIEDFRVRVRIKGEKGRAIHTRQLSEGEQQLLTVIGLMRFTRDEGSLYLLDEPDTHLNPSWTVDYLHYLRKIGGMERNSHTLIATHDPLLTAGLCKEEIRLLARDSAGRVRSYAPEESPRGRGVAGVLTSPLYGLESQLDKFSLNVLNRLYEVSFWKPSAKKTRHLSRLRRLLPDIETSESSPDPYRNIARAAYKLAQNEILNSSDDPDRKSELIERLAKTLYQSEPLLNDFHKSR